MANKSYDPSLKNKWDKVSKTLTEEVMRDLFAARLIKENEAEDLGLFTDGFWDQCYIRTKKINDQDEPKPIFVESEMKNSKEWGRGYAKTGGPPFKWDSIDIPFRKAKNKAKIFFLFSMDVEEGLGAIVTRKSMNEAIQRNNGKPKNKIARYEDEGGDYFSVPVSEVKFVEKSPNGKWRTFRP